MTKTNQADLQQRKVLQSSKRQEHTHGKAINNKSSTPQTPIGKAVAGRRRCPTFDKTLTQNPDPGREAEHRMKSL